MCNCIITPAYMMCCEMIYLLNSGTWAKKVWEGLIYKQTRKMMPTYGNPSLSPNKLTKLSHKLELWNRNPNFRVRLQIHYLKVFAPAPALITQNCLRSDGHPGSTPWLSSYSNLETGGTHSKFPQFGNTSRYFFNSCPIIKSKIKSKNCLQFEN